MCIRDSFYLFGGLLAAVLVAWWLIDRSRFGLGLKAIREDEDKSEALGIPTFAYKLVVFVVSATFTALGGGLYALWFGDLDPVFQFSVLSGSTMVLMALLGGVPTCSDRCSARWSSGRRSSTSSSSTATRRSTWWRPVSCSVSS